MDPLDKALCRAREIFRSETSPDLDAELEDLLPSLVEAGYVDQEPWGDSPDWFLWRLSESGRDRADELGCDP